MKKRFGILISVIFVFMLAIFFFIVSAASNLKRRKELILAVRGHMKLLNNIVDETKKSKELIEKGKLVISEKLIS